MPESDHASVSFQRIAIVGCPGSGKSTLARYLAEALHLEHVELDSLFHQANWVPLETAKFLEVLRSRTPLDGSWVACGNFGSSAGNDMRERADCIIFLDMPRGLTMKRVISRTFGRVLGRKVLWNGNRERWWNMLHPVPAENIILWAFLRWKVYRRRYRDRMADGSWSHAQVLHFEEHAVVEAFKASCGQRPTAPCSRETGPV
jgi:adenylate kinase family enzyme